MIYRIKPDHYNYQNIFVSPENDEVKRSKISDSWKSLESNSVWYHRTGMGMPESVDVIRNRFMSLFEMFPSEMSLSIPPSKPPDVGSAVLMKFLASLRMAIEEETEWWP